MPSKGDYELLIAGVQNQLGRLEAAQDRSTEDRREMKETITNLHGVLFDLRSAVLGLTQTVQSMTNQVLALTGQNSDERLKAHDGELAAQKGELTALRGKVGDLDRVRGELDFWRRVLGGGVHAVWKILLFMAGAGTIGELLIKAVTWLLHLAHLA